MDIIDRSSEYAAKEVDARIHEARKAVSGVSGTAVCEDCGEKIPKARRLAYPAAIRCVACQEEFENENRMRG